MYENYSILKLRRFIAIILVSGMTAVCGCDDDKGSPDSSGEETRIQSDFCSCLEGEGPYYPYAGGLIEAAGATLNLDLENRETDGSLENAELIADGECAMGLVREDAFRYLLDKSRIEEGPQNSIRASKLRVIMMAYTEQVHFLINTDNVTDADNDGSITPGDLEGKNICVGPESSGAYITARYILKSYGLDGSNCRLFTTGPEDSIDSLRSGAFDAMFVVSGVPFAPFASEDLAGAPIQLVRCTMKSGTQSGMYSEKGIIPDSSYPFQTDVIDKNLQVKNLVAVSDEFDRENLDDFFTYLDDNKETLAVNFDENWSSFGLSLSDNYLGQNPLIWDYKAAETVSGYDFDDMDHNLYSGYASGNYEKIAADISPFIEPFFGYSMNPVNSTGSGHNAIGILRGDATMAIVQDDVFDYLRSLNDSYEGMKAAKMRKIMPLYNEDVLFLVNRNSGINTIADMAGKKVCLCEKTSGSFISGLRIINSYGFDMDNAPTYYFASPSEGVQGVVAGTYDAMVLVDARPSPLLSGLTAGETPLVKLIPAKMKNGSLENDAYYNYTASNIVSLPEPDYDYSAIMPDGDLNDNLQVTAVLVVSGAADDTLVYDFIDRIYSENEAGTLTSASGWDSVNLAGGEAYFRYNPYGWSRNAARYYSDRLSD